MNMPRLLNRPNFGAEDDGGWLDPDYLLPAEKASLSVNLPKRMTSEQRRNFFSLVGESLQLTLFLQPNTTAAAEVAQLKKLECSARALLQALGKLSPDTRDTLQCHSECLAQGISVPAQLSDIGARIAGQDAPALLGYFWDAVQDVETAAAYAALNITPDKTARISQKKAKLLIEYVAWNVYKVQGRFPPFSKTAWFSKFMCALGQIKGYSIGSALVESVGKKLKADGAPRLPIVLKEH
jgi:hypothetical protein